MLASRRLLSALVPLLFGACAGHAPRPSGAEPADAGYRGPLAARILQPYHRELRFELSAPAYVAIFEIVPGRGVSVLYPTPFGEGARKPLRTGWNSVLAAPLNVGRWFYADPVLASSGPTFLYMIASREPLRIDRVLSDPASLRRVVGFANFTQNNHQRIMDALDERFVPDYFDEDSWASDWVALWPEPAPSRRPSDPRLLVLTRCDGAGVLVVVPGPTPAYACASRDSVRTPPPPPPRGPADSSAKPVTPPGDTKPAPPPPANGERPPAPRQSRREPLSLVVDYGAPLDGDVGSAPRGAQRPGRDAFARERGASSINSTGGRAAARVRSGEDRSGPDRMERGATESRTSPSTERRAEPRREPTTAPSAPATTSAGPERGQRSARSQ